ncbi:MAG: fructosamine kinase family protein [Ardenticatenaceae bacterium]|nr:fructosamine kinase family protein [Ardenticatenaceae bacterium]
MIPQNVRTAVVAALGQPIRAVRAAGGGDINRAARVVTDGGTFFLKYHPRPPAGFFGAEAAGLRLLERAGGPRVPVPVAWDDQDRPAWLLLTWLEQGRSREAAAARLGEGLAQVHRSLEPRGRFGLDQDNFCGLTPQPNGWSTDWITFFQERRLGHQMTLAAERDRLPTPRRQRLERLLARLGEWLPLRPPASLLHGDLWGGNWLPLADGSAAVIDPAVSYGHREADLAFTELFGGFPPSFRTAYEAAWPLDSDYPVRRDLYNLYHLLNHLNLFGEAYGASVDRVLARYVS